MRCYVATSLGNAAEAKALADELVKQGHSITYDWTRHGSVQSEGLERIREVATLEAQGVFGAEAVIVIMPGGRGTHVELGMAIACAMLRGSRVIILSDADHLLDSDKRTCAFYHHPTVEIVASPSEVFERLSGAKAVELPADPERLREWARSPDLVGRDASEAARAKLREVPEVKAEPPPPMRETITERKKSPPEVVPEAPAAEPVREVEPAPEPIAAEG